MGERLVSRDPLVTLKSLSRRDITKEIKEMSHVIACHRKNGDKSYWDVFFDGLDEKNKANKEHAELFLTGLITAAWVDSVAHKKIFNPATDIDRKAFVNAQMRLTEYSPSCRKGDEEKEFVKRFSGLIGSIGNDEDSHLFALTTELGYKGGKFGRRRIRWLRQPSRMQFLSGIATYFMTKGYSKNLSAANENSHPAKIPIN